MTMTIWQGAITIVTVVLGTMCTRFLPFLVFPESKQPPRIIEYFGQVLPYAMTGLLVVYALRNTPILTGSHGLPELIACTVIVLLHVWKRNMLLSIAGGTRLVSLSLRFAMLSTSLTEGGNLLYLPLTREAAPRSGDGGRDPQS